MWPTGTWKRSDCHIYLSWFMCATIDPKKKNCTANGRRRMGTPLSWSTCKRKISWRRLGITRCGGRWGKIRMELDTGWLPNREFDSRARLLGETPKCCVCFLTPVNTTHAKFLTCSQSNENKIKLCVCIGRRKKIGQSKDGGRWLLKAIYHLCVRNPWWRKSK